MSKTTLRDEIRQTRPFRSKAQEATVAILRTADVVRRDLARQLEPFGITLQQYNVLRILRGAHPKPLPTLDIADRLIERTPGITRLLDRIEEKGFVRRQRCPEDRRLVHCWITPGGLSVLAQLDPVIDAADDVSARLLSPTELDHLIDSLARVRQAIADP